MTAWSRLGQGTSAARNLSLRRAGAASGRCDVCWACHLSRLQRRWNSFHFADGMWQRTVLPTIHSHRATRPVQGSALRPSAFRDVESAMRHVLVADDGSSACNIMRIGLKADGTFRVTPTTTAQGARVVLVDDPPDAAIIDTVPPKISSLRIATSVLEAARTSASSCDA
jgi:PleD family two-component response regulator